MNWLTRVHVCLFFYLPMISTQVKAQVTEPVVASSEPNSDDYQWKPVAKPVDLNEFQSRLDQMKQLRTQLGSQRQAVSEALADTTVPSQQLKHLLQENIKELLHELMTRKDLVIPTSSNNNSVAETTETAGPTVKKSSKLPSSTNAKVKEKAVPSRLTVTPKMADLSLAKVHIRLEKYDEALQILQKLDMSAYPKVEQHNIRYLQALCLQRLNQLNKAAKLFQMVAAATDEVPLLAKSARWKLNALDWSKDMDNSINDIREKLKKLQEQK